MLLSRILEFKRSLMKHLWEEKKQSQQVDSFRHETGFGDVQCSRQCYSIFNGTSALTFF